MSNIMETNSGIKYGYFKEGIYDIEYRAICEEDGEHFYTTFFAPKGYTNEELMEIGNDCASIYGGKCYMVEN